MWTFGLASAGGSVGCCATYASQLGGWGVRPVAMYGSMSRASIAAMLVALQYPWSKAPALGLPKARGMASKVGMASA